MSGKKYNVYIRGALLHLWEAIPASTRSAWVNEKLQEEKGIVPDHYIYDESQQKWVEPRD
jgi:hypothetical protein